MPRWAWAASAVIAAAIAAGASFAYAWDRGRADLIAPGVHIAGIDVGGLRAPEARALLDLRLVPRLARPLRLANGSGRDLVVRPDGAGLRVDVDRMVADAVRAGRSGGIVRRVLRGIEGRRVQADVPVSAGLPPAALDALVREVASALSQPARSAHVTPSPSALHIVPEQPGLAVRRARLRTELSSELVRPDRGATIVVPTRTVMPRWTAAALAKRYPSYILIDREHFTLRLYRHLKLARRYPIAVGRAGLETPAGLYRITDRQVNPSWHVPLSSWAGDLAGRIIPPGPSDPIKARWLGFHDGAGIHGTEESSSIGSAASHGCIRMTIPDVIALYPLVPLHTPIYVG